MHMASVMDTTGHGDNAPGAPAADDWPEDGAQLPPQVEDTGRPPEDGTEPSTAEGKEPKGGDEWQKRYENAVRKMTEATTTAAELKGRLAVLEGMQKRQEQASVNQGPEPFEWLKDTSKLEQEFEENPSATFSKTLRSTAKDLAALLALRDEDYRRELRRLDPTSAKVEQAKTNLAGEGWFQSLPVESQDAAALAWVQAQAATGSNGGERPPAPAGHPGGGRPAPKKSNKVVPIWEDPQYADFFQRTGALSLGETKNTLLANEAKR